MSSLQRRVETVTDARLAAMADMTANLKAQLSELNRLRDQIRKHLAVWKSGPRVIHRQRCERLH